MDLKTQQDVTRRSIDTVRTLAMDAVQKAANGHPGTAMAMAPLAYTIFTQFLRHNPENPDWKDRDRFIRSAGHASMLHITGYDLTLEDLKTSASGSEGSRQSGALHESGSETTTGPLGEGFANGVLEGMHPGD